MTAHQQVLYLWANGSALDSNVVAWAFHDGSDGSVEGLPEVADGKPPYDTGVEALRDGWRLLQSAQLIAPPAGQEHLNAYLDYEFVFERLVDC
ncbi:MAG: hypothetical protein H8E59_09545 [Actinobacteria bacterium]|nr:hypothetical protein [Actinomycetota bacterium]